MTGYTKLASFMIEKEHTFVRKYQHLAVRDLLYLQAEICSLENEYDLIAKGDAFAEDERKYYNREWWYLERSKSRGFEGEQWEKALQVRVKLREYYASMLQYNQVALLSTPKDSDRKMLHTWIDSPSQGGGCGFLGRDLSGYLQPSVYDKTHKNDLVTLSPNHGEDDAFTRFLSGPVLNIFHKVWRYKKKSLPVDPENPPVGENHSGLYHYSDSHIQTAIYIIGTVAASLTPLVSVVVLYFVRNLGTRIGLVCAFTFLFSLSIALATKARRIEIFAATSAFASVQVVFVGTTNF